LTYVIITINFRGDRKVISISATTDRFFPVPNQMMQDLVDQKVDGNALPMYWLLLRDAEDGYSNLGQQRLAGMLSVSDSTIGRATTQLVKAGYLTVKRVGLGQPDRLFPTPFNLGG
jgi:hypothetical protein